MLMDTSSDININLWKKTKMSNLLVELIAVMVFCGLAVFILEKIEEYAEKNDD